MLMIFINNVTFFFLKSVFSIRITFWQYIMGLRQFLTSILVYCLKMIVLNVLLFYYWIFTVENRNMVKATTTSLKKKSDGFLLRNSWLKGSWSKKNAVNNLSSMLVGQGGRTVCVGRVEYFGGIFKKAWFFSNKE